MPRKSGDTVKRRSSGSRPRDPGSNTVSNRSSIVAGSLLGDPDVNDEMRGILVELLRSLALPSSDDLPPEDEGPAA
jgi:hypothetical protein